MKLIRNLTVLFAFFGLITISVYAAYTKAAEPLPSWNEGPAKKAILEFVATVTDANGKNYVEPTERIAVFDNDGTLWVEYPMYTQFLFAFDRVKELAPQHPEWKTEQPFKAVLEGDMKTVGASGMKGLMEIVMETHSGMTATEFAQEVSNWLATTKHGGHGGSIVLVSAATRLGSPVSLVPYAASKGAVDVLGWGLAQEVANAILWLLSDEASYVSGTNLDVSYAN
jgi:hypothetical protein